MHVCVLLLQQCPSLCNPMDYNPPGSFIHGILQAGILEWVAGPSSRGSPRPGDRPISLMFPVLAGMSFTTSATWEACLTRYILSISYFISKSVWSKQVYFPLHMPWLMLRADFLFVQQVTFMSKKILHLGENWQACLCPWVTFLLFIHNIFRSVHTTTLSTQCSHTLLMCLAGCSLGPGNFGLPLPWIIYIFLNVYLSIYLSVLGLRCSAQGLRCIMPDLPLQRCCVSSLAVLCRLSSRTQAQ